MQENSNWKMNRARKQKTETLDEKHKVGENKQQQNQNEEKRFETTKEKTKMKHKLL